MRQIGQRAQIARVNAGLIILVTIEVDMVVSKIHQVLQMLLQLA